MDENAMQDAIQMLNDLELACLVCLVADQHCIVRAPEHLLDDVNHQLESICRTTFGLSCAMLGCSPSTTIEEFCDAVVDGPQTDEDEDEISSRRPIAAVPLARTKRTESQTTNVLDSRKVANVVIAKSLDQTVRNVQIQALELMRSRRIYSRTAVHATPRRFLFICLISSSRPGPPYLTPHLNDLFFISHTHVPQSDELQDMEYPQTDNASISSFSSVIRRHSNLPSRLVHPYHRALIRDTTIAQLQKLSSLVRTTAENRRYTHNIVTFLRLHRAVAGGVSSVATRQLFKLTSILAPLHSQSYITPSLIPLAVQKVFAHRVELVTDPAAERSMQWGSDYDAVAAELRDIHEHWGPEGVLDDVLAKVPVPL